MNENNNDFTTRENFIEALDILKKAFENLEYYTGSIYLDDELWDGDNNYPFNWSFNEMPGIIEVWVEAVKKRVREGFIHGTYNVCVYINEIIPEWRGDNNLFTLEVEGTVLYDWYVNKIAETDKDKTIDAFNHWYKEVYTADDTEGLFNYAYACKGIISVSEA